MTSRWKVVLACAWSHGPIPKVHAHEIDRQHGIDAQVDFIGWATPRLCESCDGYCKRQCTQNERDSCANISTTEWKREGKNADIDSFMEACSPFYAHRRDGDLPAAQTALSKMKVQSLGVAAAAKPCGTSAYSVVAGEASVPAVAAGRLMSSATDTLQQG